MLEHEGAPGGRRVLLAVLLACGMVCGGLAQPASARAGRGATEATAGAPGETGQPSSAESEEAAQARLMALYEKMIQFNLDNEHTLKSATIDSLMATFADLSLGQKIAAWADYFWQRGDARYVFGGAEGGYVREGRLVDDGRTDCVLFFYRVTELGRSSSALEAVQFAFGTRFYGAILEEVVDAQGRVNYDDPVYLHYSTDIVRSGIWGRDITADLGKVVRDQAGTPRYPPDSVSYLPKERLDPSRFLDGDIVFFVSDESIDAGRKVRESGGLIGHIGVIKIERGEPQLIHAAGRGLDGLYKGGKVEKVPLAAYLARVENFKGLIVTRIENF